MLPLVSIITPWLVSLASAVITTSIPIAMVWLQSHLALTRNVMLNSLVSDAVTRGTGLSLADSQTAGHFVTAPAVSYVMDKFPEAISELGLTHDNITTMVHAEIGHRLNGVLPAAVLA